MTERPDQTRSAADGHFHFLDLPNGLYTLNATLPGAGSRYGTAVKLVMVSRDAQGNVTMVVADMALPPTTLTGEVSNQGGNRVVLAEVRLQGSAERAFSGAQGRYMLPGLEVGQRTVMVVAQGHQPVSQTVAIGPAGSVHTVNIVLIPAAP
jgi:hypothetical protein